MEHEQTKVSGFLSGIMPEVQVKPIIDRSQVMEIAAITFIAAFFIILAYFSFKKALK